MTNPTHDPALEQEANSFTNYRLAITPGSGRWPDCAESYRAGALAERERWEKTLADKDFELAEQHEKRFQEGLKSGAESERNRFFKERGRNWEEIERVWKTHNDFLIGPYATVQKETHQLRAENERLKEEIETYQGVHSCHARCKNPPCVLRRERDQLRAENAQLRAENENLNEFEHKYLGLNR